MAYQYFNDIVYLIEESRILRIQHSNTKRYYNKSSNIKGDEHALFLDSFGIEISLWVDQKVSTHSWNFIIFFGNEEISVIHYDDFKLYPALEFLVHNQLGQGSISAVLADTNFFHGVVLPYVRNIPEIKLLSQDIKLKASLTDSLKEAERLENYLPKVISKL